MLFYSNASVVEWSITTDCKSVALGLRRFESFPTHNIIMSLKASINAYKKLSEKQELTADDLRAMIYEFKENVDQLEKEFKKEEVIVKID